MTVVLNAVADGFAVGGITASDGGPLRFPVLGDVSDATYLRLVADGGTMFDTAIRLRGPIGFGPCVLKGRVARVSGSGGIQFSLSAWAENPKGAASLDRRLAVTPNYTTWSDAWEEFSLPIVGQLSDLLAENLKNLWIRFSLVSAIGSGPIPVLGVSALWLEVPSVEERPFEDLRNTLPPNNTFVTVQTFSGRLGVAKSVDGEWVDESGAPFEVHTSALPLGDDGKPQSSRAVSKWRL